MHAIFLRVNNQKYAQIVLGKNFQTGRS